MKSYNRYSYCFNNPLRYIDPSGYVVTIPPEFEEFFDVSSFMDLNSFTKYLENKGGDKVTYNTELSHIVNVSHAIEFSINGTNKGHEVIIWDPMFKQETNGCYRQLFDFYDRNKLYINIGIMFHKNNYK